MQTFFIQAVHLRIINPLCLDQKLFYSLLIDFPIILFPCRGADRGKNLHDPAKSQNRLSRVLLPDLLNSIGKSRHILPAGNIFLPSKYQREGNLTGDPINRAFLCKRLIEIRVHGFFPACLLHKIPKFQKQAFFHIRIHGQAVQHQKVRSVPCQDPGIQFL